MKPYHRVFAAAALIATLPTSPLLARGFVSPPACGGSYSTVVAGLGTIYFGRLTSAPASQAAILNTNPYCARQAFLNAGIGLGFVPGVDNLELQLLNLSFAGTSVTGLLTGTGNDGGFENAGPPPGNNGRYATSGTSDYYDDGTFQITTTPGVNGFGFYGTDVGDMALSSLRVTYDDATSLGTDFNYTVTGNGLFGGPNGNGNLFFLGVILNSGLSLSEVEFNANGVLGLGGDTPGYDDFTVLAQAGGGGTLAINPEPATMTLMATGLIGMAGAARRRRKKS